MVRIDNFVERLRQHALKQTTHTSGQYQLVAGLIRGNELFNISTNQGHRLHAEIAALRNVTKLCDEGRSFKQSSPQT